MEIIQIMDWIERVPFSLLQYDFVRFLADEGRPVTKEEIGQAMYGYVFTDNQVYKLIHRTRKRLAECNAPAQIESFGKGRWRLAEEA